MTDPHPLLDDSCDVLHGTLAVHGIICEAEYRDSTMQVTYWLGSEEVVADPALARRFRVSKRWSIDEEPTVYEPRPLGPRRETTLFEEGFLWGSVRQPPVLPLSRVPDHEVSG